MGALRTLEQGEAAALTGMVVHAPDGGRIHGEFIAQHGFRGFRDRGLGVRREVLDTLLIERARVAGVNVIERAKVDDLLLDGAGGCEGVRLRMADGVRDVRATMVIGADGLRSIVSRRLKLARQSRWPKRMALVAHYRGVADIGSLGEMHVTTEGYVGLASVGGGVTNVALVVPWHLAQAIAGDPDAYLTAWLARQAALAPRFVRAVRITPVRATGPFASHAVRAWAPGAALVGDAADFFDPFTGEGIYSALRGGELIAPFVTEAVQARQQGNARGAQRALRAYERARQEAFRGKWRVERLIGTAVAFPWLMNAAARVLGRDRALSDLLIGVTGDFVPPSAVLAPRTVWRALRAAVMTPAAHASSRVLPDVAQANVSTTSNQAPVPHVHR
jgi:flavin-dependent dehydrogenase